MKSVVILVLIIFVNSSSLIGFPLNKVVFPSGSEENDEMFMYGDLNKEDTKKDVDSKPKPKLKFRIDAANVPCAANSTVRFCEEISHQLYPSQHVKTVLQKNADFYADFFNKLQTRDNFPESIDLCDTYTRTILPQIAQNVESDWRFIINQPGYQQHIRVQLCQKRSSQCQFADSFPPGYVSTCTQKTTKIPLLSLDDDGQISEYEYEFPSHCQCELHRIKPTVNRSHRKN